MLKQKDLRHCPQVIWVVRTDDQQDLDWLDLTLLPSESSYRKVVPTGMLEYMAHAPVSGVLSAKISA